MVARDFVSMESMKKGGILYVFPLFHTAPAEQKIRHPPADDLFRGSQVYLGEVRLSASEVFANAKVVEN